MFVLLIVLILVGCSKNPINDRIWYGNLYRTADDSLLSHVCLRYTGDTLEVYADAVFGAGKESLILRACLNFKFAIKRVFLLSAKMIILSYHT